MYYEAYGYHEADTRPANNETSHIFGLELEIDDESGEVHDVLDEAIADDILTAPCNDHRTANWKPIENDSSVFKEIILNADTIENLLERIKTLNNWGINPQVIENTSGTSAHIHINRNYLDKRGITQTNIIKMFEFYAPVIYAISGRDEYNWERWSEPASDYSTHNINWEKRGRDISELYLNTNERYSLINATNYKTLEVRGFSNYYSFNYNILKFYLYFVQFCIDQADKMKGKYYSQHGQELIKDLEDWIKTEFIDMYYKFNLNQIIHWDAQLHRMKQNHTILKSQLRTLRHCKQRDIIYFLHEAQFMQRLEEIYKITLTEKGKMNAIKKLETKIYKELQGNYMAYYYRKSQELQEF